MPTQPAAEILAGWPEEAREAAQLVVDTYGEPQEATPSELTWRGVGPWKRIVAQKAFWQHRFPAPHTDSVESFIDYRVPPEMFTPLGQFDGSLMVERTSGEVSARCHDEQANMLALNLMNDMVTGKKTTQEARDYYSKEFLDARRKQPTPYMEKLHFTPAGGSPAGSSPADADQPTLSDQQLEQAQAEGKNAGS